MSNSVKEKDLKVYLKNSTQKEIGEKNKADLSVMSDSWKAMNEADAVTQKMLQEDDSNTSESISESDAIAFYTDSVQKTIQIKLDHNSADVLNMDEEFESGKDEKDTDKLKIYDYNESVIIENEEAESSLVKSKGTLHIVTDEKPTEELRCTHCSYTTNKRFLLTRHIKTHSTDRPLKCSFCERGFKTNISLINHVNSHLGKKPHHCKSCEMRFNTAGELGRHVRYKHTHEKPHKCGECDYSSVELSKMRRHMRCHTGERPYQCPHCTYASPDTFKLKRHLRTHTGEKPYECDICMARFTQSNSLKSHKLIHSVGERPVFQCTLCPTTCGRKTDLQLHVQNLHTSDVPIKCKRCGKELPDRYTYKVHVKTHEGEKCYRCNICPYASISQRHLDMHMLIHTDEKPFSCEQCGLSFRQRQLLMRHVNIYHNKNYVPPAPQEKNHICPHCRRAFLRKGNLMRHMEMHDTHFVNSIQKIQLKIGRKMRIPEEASSYSTIMMPENEDEVMDDNSTNDEKNIEYKLVEDENDDDVETFEVIDDLIDEAEANSEAKEKTLKCHLIYKSSPPKTKTKKKTPAVLVTSSKAFPKYENKKIQNETKKRSSNIFIVPSGSTSAPAIKKTDTHLPPIKIEYDCTKDASDTDDVNENFVIIEVIETDGVTDDTVGSNGESNSMIAGDILEIPFQAAGKRDHINTFGFVDDDEYVLPVEVNEDD